MTSSCVKLSYSTGLYRCPDNGRLSGWAYDNRAATHAMRLFNRQVNDSFPQPGCKSKAGCLPSWRHLPHLPLWGNSTWPWTPKTSECIYLDFWTSARFPLKMLRAVSRPPHSLPVQPAERFPLSCNSEINRIGSK